MDRLAGGQSHTRNPIILPYDFDHFALKPEVHSDRLGRMREVVCGQLRIIDEAALWYPVCAAFVLWIGPELFVLRQRRRPEPRRIEGLSLIHISEPTRRTPISYAVFCLKK